MSRRVPAVDIMPHQIDHTGSGSTSKALSTAKLGFCCPSYYYCLIHGSMVSPNLPICKSAGHHRNEWLFLMQSLDVEVVLQMSHDTSSES